MVNRSASHSMTSIRAFTLIEMFTVMSIITTVMALGVPALVTAQRQTDLYATRNVIASVHAACQRNAKQFGSAALVYGFTLSYTTCIDGHPAADRIKPWVADGSGVVRYHQDIGLRHAVGLASLWQGDDIVFRDLDRPCDRVVINGTVRTTTAGDRLHVAYEPVTGFPHTRSTLGSSAIPSATDVGAATFTGISDPVSGPSQIEIVVWNQQTGSARSRIVLHKTGISDVRGSP